MEEYSDFQNMAMSIGDCHTGATASSAKTVDDCDEQRDNAIQNVVLRLLHWVRVCLYVRQAHADSRTNPNEEPFRYGVVAKLG